MADNPDQGTVVDPDAYNAPGLDLRDEKGRKIDAIKIGVTGSVELARTDKRDVAYWKSLKQGERVELVVEGIVNQVGVVSTLDKDEVETVTGLRKVKVDSIDLPAPEPEEEK